MSRSSRKSQRQSFLEYFSGEIPGELFSTGTVDNIDYKLYKRFRLVDGEKKASHYTAYVKVIPAECTHVLRLQSLPPAPGHRGLNFGPTTDKWIGFGTLDGKDHNYHDGFRPFGEDYRLQQDELYSEHESIYNWTASTLEDSIREWIPKLRSHVETAKCRSCNTQ